MLEENELAEERKNFLKGLFPKMKNWYISDNVSESFREKYGDYPLFWQDLEHWRHTKILKKIFLCVSEKKEAGHEVDDIFQIEKQIIDAESLSTFNDGSTIENIENVSTSAEPTERGQNMSNNVNEVKFNNNAVSDPTIVDEPKKRKKNRWGVAPIEQTGSTDGTAESKIDSNEVASMAASEAEVKKPRKSRWSQDTGTDTLSTTAQAPILSFQIPVVPVIQPQPPSQEQLQQTIVLKMQLQQINQKLLTVAQDSAVIEADPNRSPSPRKQFIFLLQYLTIYLIIWCYEFCVT